MKQNRFCPFCNGKFDQYTIHSHTLKHVAEWVLQNKNVDLVILEPSGVITDKLGMVSESKRKIPDIVALKDDEPRFIGELALSNSLKGIEDRLNYYYATESFKCKDFLLFDSISINYQRKIGMNAQEKDRILYEENEINNLFSNYDKRFYSKILLPRAIVQWVIECKGEWQPLDRIKQTVLG